MSGIFAAFRTDAPMDGGTWIAADARVDDRQTLAAALGVPHESARSDEELILHAYMKWDVRCVEHLIGDFAFAIWDGRARRLFCARDHFGIKPLYYAHRAPWLLAGRSVDALREHPAISDALDDVAVADFLLFGHKTDPAATTFRDIRRVPPAHTLTWSRDGGCRLHRYWELPIDEPVYRKDADYAAELRQLLDRAVADRVRGERAGVFFSGGLDSTAVAATARRHAASSSIRGFCFLHESLLADEERRYATVAAAHLGIECRFYEMDSAGWSHAGRERTPEPLVPSIDASAQARCLDDAADHSRIALTGEGADNALLYEWASYVRYLLWGGRIGRLAVDCAEFVRHSRRVPLAAVLTYPRSRLANDGAQPVIPSWISPDLVDRLHLEERWRDVMRPAASPHQTRPAAYFSLQLPLWQDLFDSWDPSYTGVALDVRHPFLDLRVLRFLLSVPVIPWCREKYLLRYAFAADLPPQVRRRPKTPLPGSPEHAKIARDGLPPVMRSPRLGAYAESAYLRALPTSTSMQAEAALRLVTFSRWLAGLESMRVAAATD